MHVDNDSGSQLRVNYARGWVKLWALASALPTDMHLKSSTQHPDIHFCPFLHPVKLLHSKTRPYIPENQIQGQCGDEYHNISAAFKWRVMKKYSLIGPGDIGEMGHHVHCPLPQPISPFSQDGAYPYPSSLIHKSKGLFTYYILCQPILGVSPALVLLFHLLTYITSILCLQL